MSQTTSPSFLTAHELIAYDQLVAEAKARVLSGQLTAFRAVNKELISLY